MIRKILMQNSSKKLTDNNIKTVFEMATDDIKVNRISCNKPTPIAETVNITMRCLRTLERCL